MAFKFRAVEPGVAYEYITITDAGRRIGLVRKEEATKYPYDYTGRWVADNSFARKAGLPTRRAAAEWLATWR